MKATPEEFVRIWQAAESVKEVTEKCGGEYYQEAHLFAAYLRRRGVPLKELGKNKRTIDRTALVDLMKLRDIAYELH